jgi:hypothetical protein
MVSVAAKLLHKWFRDEDLGMCRVLRFTGVKGKKGAMEPVLEYAYVDEGGKVVKEKSSFAEVKKWVQADTTNL